MEKNAQNSAALAAELDSLESLLQLLLQKSVAATDATAFSAEIDDVLAQVEADDASVEEMERMLGAHAAARRSASRSRPRLRMPRRGRDSAKTVVPPPPPAERSRDEEMTDVPSATFLDTLPGWAARLARTVPAKQANTFVIHGVPADLVPVRRSRACVFQLARRLPDRRALRRLAVAHHLQPRRGARLRLAAEARSTSSSG